MAFLQPQQILNPSRVNTSLLARALASIIAFQLYLAPALAAGAAVPAGPGLETLDIAQRTALAKAAARGDMGSVGIVGGEVSSAAEADAFVEQMSAEFKQAAAEGPADVESSRQRFKILDFGGRLADRVTRAILMKSEVPIDHMTPRERMHHYRTSEQYKGAFRWTLGRAIFNAGVSSVAVIITHAGVNPLALIPNILTILLISGGIQLGIDPFHSWTVSGDWSRKAFSRFKNEPLSDKEWSKDFSRWAGREFYAKWFLTQFVFIMGINLALLSTGLLTGHTLLYLLAGAVMNSLFGMFAEGIPEKGAVGVTRAREREEVQRESERLGRELTGVEAKAISKYWDNVRRGTTVATGGMSTAFSSLRTTQGGSLLGVFIPSDLWGGLLVGMGFLGLAANKFLMPKSAMAEELKERSRRTEALESHEALRREIRARGRARAL